MECVRHVEYPYNEILFSGGTYEATELTELLTDLRTFLRLILLPNRLKFPFSAYRNFLAKS